MNLNLPELIARLQEAHALLGLHPDSQVRFQCTRPLDDENGTPLDHVEVEYGFQLAIIYN
jgi:hypothetical protein